MSGKEARATRGKRATELAGKDAEFDQEFYQSEFWADGDDSDNEDYVLEGSGSEDEFDSDFNDSEDDAAEEDEDDEENIKRLSKKQKTKESQQANKYKDPSSKGITNKRKVSFLQQGEEEGDEGREGESVDGNNDGNDEENSETPKKAKKPRIDPSLDSNNQIEWTPRALRQSTVVKSQDAIVNRKKDEVQREIKGKVKTLPPIKHQFKQEELLKECLATEIENQKWLEAQKNYAKDDELMNDKLAKQKSKNECIRFISKRGQYNVIVFPSVECMPQIFQMNQTVPQPIQKPICVITGLPAKYRHPKTKEPYATTEAYRILTEIYNSQI